MGFVTLMGVVYISCLVGFFVYSHVNDPNPVGRLGAILCVLWVASGSVLAINSL